MKKQETVARDRTYRVLRDLGVPEHLSGFGCLTEAVTLAACDPSLTRKLTASLYPEVGRRCNCTAAAAERAMRHAIETAWIRSDPRTQTFYFGSTIDPGKGKPVNSEFIARISDAVRQEVLC